MQPVTNPNAVDPAKLAEPDVSARTARRIVIAAEHLGLDLRPLSR